MKSLSLLLVFALISLSSSNDIGDKIKCIIENENIRKNVMDIINSIIAKEDLKTIIFKIISYRSIFFGFIRNCLKIIITRFTVHFLYFIPSAFRFKHST